MANIKKVFISHCWDYENDYDTIKDWINNAPYYEFYDYSISADKKLVGLSDYDLANAIKEQIRQCSVFIVPTAVYSSYSEWVKFEINAAVVMQKPILAINPWGQQHYSVIVTTHANKIVGWNSKSVIDGIKELTR